MKPLGRGRASTVFDIGDGRVLRRGGNPEREARVMEHARERGFPVPRVVERRPDALVLERIAGRTMLDDLARRPWRMRAHARTLADLHNRLHAIAAPPDLRAAGEGNALLHLDLHPMNVLLSPRGPVVIDWTNAHRGNPAMDVALTWLLGMTAEIPVAYARLLARRFSQEFAKAVGVSRVRAGLSAAADYRLRDANVLESESRRIERLLQQMRFAPARAGYEGRVQIATVADVLSDAVNALDDAQIPYVLIGGLASSVHGRPRASDDIDLLIREPDATRALDVFAAAGFETEETNPQWIYKARKADVEVDLIFWLKGDIYLDDEMLERAREGEFEGVRVRVMPPEDLIVVKAVIHDEQTPRHWGDALGVIADADLDWEYLARRARKGARRVLALLIYAQSNDLVVTDEAVRTLFDSLYRE